MSKNILQNWTIFYQLNDFFLPIYEGDDGEYYLGGGSRNIKHLLFTRRVDAFKTAQKIRKDPWFRQDMKKNGSQIVTKRFKIEPVE